jgi:hypothetical protein
MHCMALVEGRSKIQDRFIVATLEKLGSRDPSRDKKDLLRSQFNEGQVQIPCVELKFLRYDHEFASKVKVQYDAAAAIAKGVTAGGQLQRQREIGGPQADRELVIVMEDGGRSSDAG